jgi:hypothetical protein
MSSPTATAIGREIADNLAVGDIIESGDSADMVASTIASAIDADRRGRLVHYSDVLAQRDALLARSATCWLSISRAQDVVRKLQWCEFDTDSRQCRCPACGGFRDNGHRRKGCAIDAFLGLSIEDLIGPPATKEPAP